MHPCIIVLLLSSVIRLHSRERKDDKKLAINQSIKDYICEGDT